VAVHRDAPFARVNARGRTVADRVDEKQHVAGFEVTFDRALDVVNRRRLAMLDLVLLEVRMLEIGLVRAGDHHGRTVAGPDVLEGHKNVDLSPTELAVVEAELAALHRLVAAGVESNRLARAADVGKILVDEKRTMLGIEIALSADEMPHFLVPGGMVDQPLER